MRALTLLLLAACVDEPIDTYRYECKLVATCGEHGHFVTVPVCGTVEEVTGFGADWTHSCSALYGRPEVESGECPFVLCGAICQPDAAGPEACPANEELSHRE